jgi:hypothetical protein
MTGDADASPMSLGPTVAGLRDWHGRSSEPVRLDCLHLQTDSRGPRLRPSTFDGRGPPPPHHGQPRGGWARTYRRWSASRSERTGLLALPPTAPRDPSPSWRTRSAAVKFRRHRPCRTGKNPGRADLPADPGHRRTIGDDIAETAAAVTLAPARAGALRSHRGPWRAAARSVSARTPADAGSRPRPAHRAMGPARSGAGPLAIGTTAPAAALRPVGM